MKQILCLSNTPWSTNPTRTQQLLSRLPNTSVLFLEPPGSQTDGRGRKVRPNIIVYQMPKTIDVASRSMLVNEHNQRHLTSFIEKVMARHHFREPLLWCTTPRNVSLLDYLAYRGLVYDCQRYWSGLPVRWEGELAADADLCFVASEGLADRLAPCNENVALLPNGVNYPLFSKENPEVPADVADLKGRPVLGFVGTLSRDLRIAPLLRCAQEHPEWTFLLIGSVAKSDYLPDLKQLKNIRILGRKPLVDLPDYLGVCQVCLHLLRQRDKDSDVLPSRLYEYLAAGKPVVSMLWQYQPEEYADVFYYARTVPDFVTQCQKAMKEDPSVLRKRRQDYGAAADWANRSRLVAQLLEGNGF